MRLLCRISFCSLVPLWEKSHCKTEKLIRSLPCLLLRFSHSGANTKWRRASAAKRDLKHLQKLADGSGTTWAMRKKMSRGLSRILPPRELETRGSLETGGSLETRGAWRPEATLHYRSKMHDVIGKTAVESWYFHICFNGFTSVLFHLTLVGALNHQRQIGWSKEETNQVNKCICYFFV